MGVFILLCLFIGYIVYCVKVGSCNGKNRYEAELKNEPYYMDYEGKHRRVDNGHQVLQHTIDPKTFDTVDLDLKTGEVLRNYSQEQRDKWWKEEQKIFQENQRRKMEAIKNGRLWYISHDPTPMTAKLDFNRRKYKSVYRRVSDDLLLKDTTYKGVMEDARTGLIVWRNPKDYGNEICDPTLEKDKKWNWYVIKSEVCQKYANMTEQELEEYARKIGALL